MMATLRCDHPDIEAFIAAKRAPGRLGHFNLSVQVTDAFMRAVAADAPWTLTFPEHPPYQVTREISSRFLWQKLLQASFECGEPGVLFVDQINRMNNLRYCERISATNPCGEVPLPPYGGCDLGSINLAAFVLNPFTPAARLDRAALAAIVPVAVRMLDNVLDITQFPLPQQAAEVRAKRRLGLGITGLADALLMLGLRYGDGPALAFAADTMKEICHAAYRASAALAVEKGHFPAFEREAYLAAPFIGALPPDIGASIASRGLRNSHLLAIAPAGTISLLAGNLSSGAEPVFAADAQRIVLDAFGTRRTVRVTDYAVGVWRRRHGGNKHVPEAFVAAQELTAERHLAMQAALQTYVDQSISKTINFAEGAGFDSYAQSFMRAYELGLKGCTVFRARPADIAVITAL